MAPEGATECTRVAAERWVQVIPSPRFTTAAGIGEPETLRLCVGCPKDNDEVWRGGEILAAILKESPPYQHPVM